MDIEFTLSDALRLAEQINDDINNALRQKGFTDIIAPSDTSVVHLQYKNEIAHLPLATAKDFLSSSTTQDDFWASLSSAGLVRPIV